jgi:divalent metal cation (Fe/Co/Zn/Cd) transporter
MSAVASPRAERERLIRRAKLLAWGGNWWHVGEFAVALGAGVAAGSIALTAFGIDSLIELAAGSVIIWRLAARRVDSETAERHAQQLISGTYALLAAYVAVEATRALIDGTHPGPSWIGIALAAVTAPTMPLLAVAKRRVGRALGSQATASEGMQNMICAYLSVALLVGLGANALLGWWWADPVAALVIGAVAAREAVESWRGESCSCCAPLVIAESPQAPGVCHDGCCQPTTLTPVNGIMTLGATPTRGPLPPGPPTPKKTKAPQ